MATAPATLDYQTYLRFYGLHPTAASALAWLKSGHAPAGTPIPAALQPHMGGSTVVTGTSGTYNVPLAPGQAPTGFTPLSFTTAPGTPAGTLPQYQSPYTPQFQSILREVANLGATYNPQRQAVATQTAANLAGSGLVDFGNTPGAPTVKHDASGNPYIAYDYTQQAGSVANAFNPTGVPDINYGLVQGADGRSYLQAYSGTSHNFASRGVASGSQVDVAQRDARLPLDLQRQQAYTGMQSQQANITGQEQARVGQLQNSWAQLVPQAIKDANDTVAGWSVTPSVPATTSTTGLSPSGPSPLTQMTGGQRTVTGAAGKATVKKIGAAVPKVGQSVFAAAKTMKPTSGVTTTKLGG